MTNDALHDRMTPLINARDDSDWRDVMRRTRAGRRGRSFAVLPIAATVAALLAGSAFALREQIVNFLDTEPAPNRVVLDFNKIGSHSDQAGAPQPSADEARKIMDLTLQGRAREMFVTPDRGGGFCWLIDELYGSCGGGPGDPRLGTLWLEINGQPGQVAGHISATSAVRLDVRYEDGSQNEIPITWVSPPIDAGFFAFDVPREHLAPGRRARTLIAIDEDGDVVARTTVPVTSGG